MTTISTTAEKPAANNFDLADDGPASTLTDVVGVNCDFRIHRFVRLNLNASINRDIEIIPSVNSQGENQLTINFRNGIAKVVTCPGIFTPPSIGVAVKEPVDNVRSFRCTPDPRKSRVLEMGVELSSDPRFSVVYLSKANTVTGGRRDYWLITDDTGDTHEADANNPKIPPYTDMIPE